MSDWIAVLADIPPPAPSFFVSIGPAWSALGLTLVIETLVMLIAAQVALTPEIRPPLVRLALVTLLANAFTQPLLWSAVIHGSGDPVFTLAMEVGVVAVEAVIYAQLLGLDTGRAALLSLLANVTSYSIGLLLFNR
ncbi:MAG: hypothetical protein ABI743_10480 [bacterium]